jgi:hypothetical protein
MPTGSYRFATAMICGSLLVSSSAANATASISSWAALSAFGTQSSRDAACSAGTAAAAAGAASAAQAAGSGCVLPVADAPPPPPVVQDVPIPPPPVETAGGIGISPLVLALGALALAGLIYLIANGDDDDEGSPLSPP